MTNKVFIKQVAEATGKSQKETKEFLDAVETILKTSVSAAVVSGDKVKVLDTTYAVKPVSARSGRNPATGETISIPATRKVAVKVSKDFKELVK